jgi:hypothetical protein
LSALRRTRTPSLFVSPCGDRARGRGLGCTSSWSPSTGQRRPRGCGRSAARARGRFKTKRESASYSLPLLFSSGSDSSLARLLLSRSLSLLSPRGLTCRAGRAGGASLGVEHGRSCWGTGRAIGRGTLADGRFKEGSSSPFCERVCPRVCVCVCGACMREGVFVCVCVRALPCVCCGERESFCCCARRWPRGELSPLLSSLSALSLSSQQKTIRLFCARVAERIERGSSPAKHTKDLLPIRFHPRPNPDASSCFLAAGQAGRHSKSRRGRRASRGVACCHAFFVFTGDGERERESESDQATAAGVVVPHQGRGVKQGRVPDVLFCGLGPPSVCLIAAPPGDGARSLSLSLSFGGGAAREKKAGRIAVVVVRQGYQQENKSWLRFTHRRGGGGNRTSEEGGGGGGDGGGEEEKEAE